MVPKRDAILVLGSGVRAGGALPTWVNARIRRAVELYSGELVIALSAGTPHRPPPVDDRGFPIFESVAAAHVLIRAGIPADRIRVETCSYDTIGNAFFARLIHTDPLELRNLLVITSDFHLPRTEAVFRWVYSLTPTHLEFEGVADPLMDVATFRERSAREECSLKSLLALAPSITTFRQLHEWIFTRHGAYAAGIERRETASPAALDSY